MMHQPPASQEVVLFQDSEVTVTTGRFQIGATMYPIRGITSVSSGFWNQPGSKGAAWLFAVLALVTIASTGTNPTGGWVLAAIFAALAVVSSVRATTTVWHTVVVHTGGMQQTAVTTKDQQRRDAIVAALHRAVTGG